MAVPASPFDYESAVEACARGERTALRALYEREAAWLLGVALRIVRNRDSARDVLQDAFVQIWTRRHLPAHAGFGPRLDLYRRAPSRAG